MSNVGSIISSQHQSAINDLDQIKRLAKCRQNNRLVYAGDITPLEAWFMLREDLSCKLCDVRTSAEWNYVGVPDLSTLEKEPILLSWQSFPSMKKNIEFINDLTKIVPTSSTTLLFICRSGSRSAAAAEYCANEGYTNCFNIIDGFEGPPNVDSHRGGAAGWKHQSLPWVQS